MTESQVTVPLQLMCQLMTVGLVTQNMTVSLIPKRAVAETNDSRVLPAGYVEFPELGFAYKLFSEMLTYDEARRKCLKENAQLAVIDSRDKVEKILNHFNQTPYVSTGLVRAYGTEEWTTVDGKSTSNLPWARGEPRGDGNCAYLSRRSRALHDERCDRPNHVLCEIKLSAK